MVGKSLLKDESGDLGFDFTKEKTSKYFVVTFLFTANKNPLEKVVKSIFSGFSRREIKAHHGVLHCYKEKPKIRQKLLESLSTKQLSIIAILLNKGKVYTKLQNEKHVLYNYVTNILLDRIYSKKLIPLEHPIDLIASRRETNRFLNDNFKDYLSRQVKDTHKQKINIEIKHPSQEKVLQIVDFVCWSIFRRIERGDDFYYRLIKPKIVEENPLFP